MTIFVAGKERPTPGSPEKPKNRLDANPNCKICGGCGWKQSRKYDGHWFVCPCVNEMRDQYLTAVKPGIDYVRLGLIEDELSLTWNHMRPDISDGMKAVEAIKPAYERGHGMIFLWGTWGQGKTLIGKILTAVALRDNKRGAYANMSAVLDDIRLAFDDEHQSTELLRRMDWWIERDVLFLDELDKANATSWAQERMFQLLDQRYMRAVREQALTVVASNEATDALDGYLHSRLQDRRLGPVIYLNGPDGRKFVPDGWRH